MITNFAAQVEVITAQAWVPFLQSAVGLASTGSTSILEASGAGLGEQGELLTLRAQTDLAAKALAT